MKRGGGRGRRITPMLKRRMEEKEKRYKEKGESGSEKERETEAKQGKMMS